MKNTKAITFRLSDEVSNELEVLRQKLGYPTMNQTIEHVVLNFRKTANSLINMTDSFVECENQRMMQRDRVARFVQALKELMEP